jgi:hypothetical protein
MKYTYRRSKGAAKPAKGKPGLELTGFKTDKLGYKGKRLIQLTEEVNEISKHPEKHCNCQRHRKNFCTHLTPGDPCPALTEKLASVMQMIKEVELLPEDAPAPINPGVKNAPHHWPSPESACNWQPDVKPDLSQACKPNTTQTQNI